MNENEMGLDPELAELEAIADAELAAELAELEAIADAELEAEAQEVPPEQTTGGLLSRMWENSKAIAGGVVKEAATGFPQTREAIGKPLARGAARFGAAAVDAGLETIGVPVAGAVVGALESLQYGTSSSIKSYERSLIEDLFKASLEDDFLEWAGPPDEGVGGFVEQIAKWGTGAFFGGAALRTLGAGSTLATVGGGAIADAFFDDIDYNLANVVQDFGPDFIQSELVDYLAASEDDSTAEKRLKAAATGVIGGAVLDTMMLGFRHYKQARKLHKAGAPTSEVQEALAKAAAAFDDLESVPTARYADEVSEAASLSPAVSEAESALQAVARTEPAPVNKAVVDAEGVLQTVTGEAPVPNTAPNVVPESLPKHPGARVMKHPEGGYTVAVDGVPFGPRFRTLAEADNMLVTAEFKLSHDALPVGSVDEFSKSHFKLSGDASTIQVNYAQSKDEVLAIVDELGAEDMPVHTKRVRKSPERPKQKEAPQPAEEAVEEATETAPATVNVKELEDALEKAQKAYDRAKKNLAESEGGKRVNLLETRKERMAKADERLKAAKKALKDAQKPAKKKAAPKAPKRPVEARETAPSPTPSVTTPKPPTANQMLSELYPGLSARAARREASALLGEENFERRLKGLYNWTHAQTSAINRLSKMVAKNPNNTVAIYELGRALDTLGRVYNPTKYDVFAERLAPEAADIVGKARAPKAEPKAKPKAKDSPKAPKEEPKAAPKGASKDKPANSAVPKSIEGLDKRQIQRVAAVADMADGDPVILAKLVKNPEEAAAALAAKTADPVAKKGIRDWLVGWYMETLLLGPLTHMKNILSTTAFMGVKPIGEGWMGGAYEFLRPGGNKQIAKEMMREGSDILQGYFMGWRENMRMAAKALKSGNTILEPGNPKWDAHHQLGELSWGNSLFTTARRMLMAEDEFMKQAAYRSKVRAEFFKEQRRLGVFDPEELNRLWNEHHHMFYDPQTGAATNAKGLRFAQDVTFTRDLRSIHQGGGPLEHMGLALQQASRDNPVLPFVIPFVRTPYRVFEAGVQHMPGINMLNKEMREKLLHGDPEEKARAMGATLFGTSVGLMGLTLAYSGLITGSGPRDYRLRKGYEDNGWRPNSFVWHGDDGKPVYISYESLFPVAYPLNMVANLADSLGEIEDESVIMNIMNAVITSLSSMAMDQTFAGDFAELMDIITSADSPDEIFGAVEKVGVSMLSPNLFNQINPDVFKREADTFWEKVMARYPVLSGRLPPRRNVFGEPVRKKDGPLHPFNPLTISKTVDPEIDWMLEEMGTWFSAPSEMVGAQRSINMNDPKYAVNMELDGHTVVRTPYDAMMERVGQMRDREGRNLREEFTEVLAPRLRGLPKDSLAGPGGQFKARLGEMLERRYEAALRETIAEWPALAQDIQMSYALDRASQGLGLKQAEENISKASQARAVERVLESTEALFGGFDE